MTSCRRTRTSALRRSGSILIAWTLALSQLMPPACALQPGLVNNPAASTPDRTQDAVGLSTFLQQFVSSFPQVDFSTPGIRLVSLDDLSKNQGGNYALVMQYMAHLHQIAKQQDLSLQEARSHTSGHLVIHLDHVTSEPETQEQIAKLSANIQAAFRESLDQNHPLPPLDQIVSFVWGPYEDAEAQLRARGFDQPIHLVRFGPRAAGSGQVPPLPVPESADRLARGATEGAGQAPTSGPKARRAAHGSAREALADVMRMSRSPSFLNRTQPIRTALLRIGRRVNPATRNRYSDTTLRRERNTLRAVGLLDENNVLQPFLQQMTADEFDDFLKKLDAEAPQLGHGRLSEDDLAAVKTAVRRLQSEEVSRRLYEEMVEAARTSLQPGSVAAFRSRGLFLLGQLQKLQSQTPLLASLQQVMTNGPIMYVSLGAGVTLPTSLHSFITTARSSSPNYDRWVSAEGLRHLDYLRQQGRLVASEQQLLRLVFEVPAPVYGVDAYFEDGTTRVDWNTVKRPDGAAATAPMEELNLSKSPHQHTHARWDPVRACYVRQSSGDFGDSGDRIPHAGQLPTPAAGPGPAGSRLEAQGSGQELRGRTAGSADQYDSGTGYTSTGHADEQLLSQTAAQPVPVEPGPEAIHLTEEALAPLRQQIAALAKAGKTPTQIREVIIPQLPKNSSLRLAAEGRLQLEQSVARGMAVATAGLERGLKMLSTRFNLSPDEQVVLALLVQPGQGGGITLAPDAETTADVQLQKTLQQITWIGEVPEGLGPVPEDWTIITLEAPETPVAPQTAAILAAIAQVIEDL